MRVVQRQTSIQRHAVQVCLVHQCLRPRMEHRNNADVSALVFWTSRDRLQCSGGGLEPGVVITALFR